MTLAPPLRQPAAGADGPGRSPSLDLARRRRPKERAIRMFLFACGVLSIITTAGIVLTLAFETIEFFREVSPLRFLTGTRWSPLIKPKAFGVVPLVNGTLMIAVISAVVGVPLGVGTAIYLSEYASRRVRNRLKPTLELLAGMPTVILGYFALTFLTPVIIRNLFPRVDFYNALSAGIVVGIMIVPIIASVSEDAMAAVPRALREGAYGLGASKMSVAVRVVVPAAFSGIMASIILGISRAVGETMIVTTASGQRANLGQNPLESHQVITSAIAQLLFGDVERTSVDYKSIFALGAVLFFMTLALNIVSQRLVRRYRQVY